MGCWGGGEGGGSAKPSAHVQRSGCGGYRGPAGPSRASGRAACSGPDARPWLCSWTPRLSPLPAGCAPTVLMLLDRCLQLVLPAGCVTTARLLFWPGCAPMVMLPDPSTIELLLLDPSSPPPSIPPSTLSLGYRASAPGPLDYRYLQVMFRCLHVLLPPLPAASSLTSLPPVVFGALDFGLLPHNVTA